MLAAIGDSGRFGLTAVGDSREEAEERYEQALAVFEEEATEALRPSPL
jgi:predicted RNase H-like HicB family nuclease